MTCGVAEIRLLNHRQLPIGVQHAPATVPATAMASPGLVIDRLGHRIVIGDPFTGRDGTPGDEFEGVRAQVPDGRIAGMIHVHGGIVGLRTCP